MSRHRKELRRLVRGFLAERDAFWAFHQGFLTHWTQLPRSEFSEQEHRGWNEIYSWILTAIPDPVAPADSARGVIGESELRERLQRHPYFASGA